MGHEEGAPIWSALDVQKEADRILLARYAPVRVVIDEAMTVLQFRGRTSAYLEPAPGMATLDLFRMLREGLLTEMRSAINQAKRENAPVVRERIRVVDGDAMRLVRVEVVPFKVSTAAVRFFLVLFQDVSTAETAPAAEAARLPLVNGGQQVGQLQVSDGPIRRLRFRLVRIASFG